MLTGLLIFTLCMAALAALVVVHECGHFTAGMAVGIPRRAMRICLFAFPPHVALRDAGEWVHPWDYARYVALSSRYLTRRGAVMLYLSAGLLWQTVVFAGAMWMLVRMGQPRFYLLPVAVSALFMPLSYLWVDYSLARRRGMPAGDYSAMWAVSPAATALVTGFVVFVHLGVLYYVGQVASPVRTWVAG